MAVWLIVYTVSLCTLQFEDCRFEWLYWPQSREPFSGEAVEYVRCLDAEEDIDRHPPVPRLGGVPRVRAHPAPRHHAAEEGRRERAHRLRDREHPVQGDPDQGVRDRGDGP